jgi:iron complex transport system substrate-binding protein
MKYYRLFIYLAFFLFSCTEKKTKSVVLNTEGIIKYAKNIEIIKNKDFVLVHLKDPETNQIEKRFALNKNNSKVPKGYIEIKTPITSIVALSSTHIGMLAKLNLTSIVSGISNHLYVYDPLILKKYQSGQVIEMGDENSIPVELIITSKSNVLMYSGFGNDFPHEEQLEKIGIICLANYDWREIHPLGKAEWIKLFGYLTRTEKKANHYFSEVEKEYNDLKKIALKLKSKPSLFSGSLAGDTWYSPSGESFNAVLFKDANCNYKYAKTKGTGSIALSFEQIFKDNRLTEFWLNPGVVSKKELLSVQSKFGNFEAFKNDKVFSYSHSGNEFWERSAIEPHHVLSDLIHILHPEIKNKRNSYFYRQLK